MIPSWRPAFAGGGRVGIGTGGGVNEPMDDDPLPVGGKNAAYAAHSPVKTGGCPVETGIASKRP